jgi:hypothetical protein
MLRLFLTRPPWPAIGLAVLAALLTQAPDPTNPEAGGISPRLFAAPILGLALAAALPGVLRALSQKRALATGEWIAARVSSVEMQDGEAGLPRHRIMWADPAGRAGRSLVIRKHWVPPRETKIWVLQDPTTGKQWWEGDLPGAIPAAALAGTEVNPRDAKRASLSAAFSRVGTWVAIFGVVVTVMLALASTPLLLTAVPAFATILGLRSTVLHGRALDRALRYGRRVQAKVTAHRAPRIGLGSRLNQPKGAAMLWQTANGHFGETDFVSSDRLVPVGKSLTVCLDPVSGEAFWDGV